jgi:hypothetical protein
MRWLLALIAAASIIALSQVPSVAEEKGLGCDLKVKGSGCEPGKAVQPSKTYPPGGSEYGPGDIGPAHHGGGDKPHSTPTGGGEPPPPPPVKTQ